MSYALPRCTVSGNDRGQGVHRCLLLLLVLLLLRTPPWPHE